jgi:hypothetical protein
VSGTAEEKDTRLLKAVWLILAEGGGWWTVEEVREALPPDLQNAPNRLSSLMWCMVKRNRILEKRGEYLTTEYAVTAKCLLPRDVTAAEAAKALLGALACECKKHDQ